MRFRDRVDAGRRLALLLASYAGQPGWVLGIPRGGVVVAAEVARRLAMPLRAVSVKKVPCPFNPELALGAVAPDGTCIINREAVRALLIGQEELQVAVRSALEEARRREALYGPGVAQLEGRLAIVVDDGLATGYTAIAAARYVRRRGASPVLVATPVAARLSARLVLDECHRLVALTIPEDLESVGQWYDDFRPIGDAEVLQLLKELEVGSPPPGA